MILVLQPNTIDFDLAHPDVLGAERVLLVGDDDWQSFLMPPEWTKQPEKLLVGNHSLPGHTDQFAVRRMTLESARIYLNGYNWDRIVRPELEKMSDLIHAEIIFEAGWAEILAAPRLKARCTSGKDIAIRIQGLSQFYPNIKWSFCDNRHDAALSMLLAIWTYRRRLKEYEP